MIIAIEGIDASGKCTLAKNLKNFCSDYKLFEEIHVLSFPDYNTATGKEIYRRLRDGSADSDPMALQSLMTINRYEHVKTLTDFHQNSNKLLILDRYFASGYAYGKASGIDLQWLIDAHQALPHPDHWIFLDLPVRKSMERKRVREDQYENNFKFLLDVRRNYFEIMDMGLMKDVHLVDVCEASAIEVAEQVISNLGLSSIPGILWIKGGHLTKDSMNDITKIWTNSQMHFPLVLKDNHVSVEFEPSNFTPKNIRETFVTDESNPSLDTINNLHEIIAVNGGKLTHDSSSKISQILNQSKWLRFTQEQQLELDF